MTDKRHLVVDTIIRLKCLYKAKLVQDNADFKHAPVPSAHSMQFQQVFAEIPDGCPGIAVSLLEVVSIVHWYRVVVLRH